MNHRTEAMIWFAKQTAIVVYQQSVPEAFRHQSVLVMLGERRTSAETAHKGSALIIGDFGASWLLDADDPEREAARQALFAVLLVLTALMLQPVTYERAREVLAQVGDHASASMAILTSQEPPERKTAREVLK